MWRRRGRPGCSDGGVEVVEVNGSTKVAAVVGWPIAHSLSPAIHNAGFRSTGVDWTYVALPVQPDHEDRIVEMCVRLGLAGLSVTMPYKTSVAGQVDDLDEVSRRLKSVNTVSFDGSRRTTGHSTDGDGLVDSLAHDGVELAGRRILVIGTGGAGRSVIEAVSRRSPQRLLVTNRSAGRLDPSVVAAPFEWVPWTDREEAVAAVDIVINCTSVGMGADTSTPFDTMAIGDRHTIVDLVYHPMDTKLLTDARTKGARCIGGLGMLVHQAARQQRIWTGHQPDVDVMTSVARSALLARG